MKSPNEIYWDYVNWCLRMELPPMSRPEYEKALQKIPSSINNTDAILRNNIRKKDNTNGGF